MQQSFSNKINRHKVIVIAVLAALPLIATAEDTLPEVSVSAKSVTETALGNVEDYVANRSITATKTDTPIIQTPQSISIVTQQQILEQGAYTLQDTLNYTTGVTAGAYGLDNRGDWFFVRGVEPTQLYDGLRSHVQSFDIPRPDPYFLERVEVLRGPGSVLFGQGSVGGTVNVVSKRPQEETSRQINVQYGMYDRKQVGIDLTGKLDDSGELLYRFVGLAKDTGTQVEFTDNKRYQIAPSITWRPSDNTSLNVQLNIQKDETDGATAAFLPHSGTVVANPNGNIPSRRFTGEPGIDKTHMDYQAINWQFEHAFNDTWTIRQNGRYSNIDYDYVTLYPNIFGGVATTAFFTNPQMSEVTRFGYANQAQTRTFSLDNNVQAKFDLADTQHTIIAGVDYFKTKVDEKNAFTFISTPFNLFNPTYGNFDRAELPNATNQADNTTDQIGFYLQDQIKLGQHWAFTAGLRHDETNKSTQGVAGEQTDRELTGRIGVVYLADNGLAPYASYTESFTPVIGANIFGVPYKPLMGEQYEIGLRYQPVDSNSRYTISYFDLEQKNALSPDPNNPLNQSQRGNVTSKGLELEALANLTDNIDLIASYAYTKARRNDGMVTTRVAEVHDHVASAWATYKFSIADIPGFKVGAGLRYIGRASDETDTLNIPSVTLLDAMFSYENKDWRAAINGTNLGDKTYISTVLSRGDVWYANRMNIVASFTYKF
ncbi:MAG: TonB-dependent siderophore receptor [Pseudomonadota bacterium]